MDDNFEKKFIELFTQGFEAIVLPEIERVRAEMATKKDLKAVESKLGNLENRFDNLERKVDHFTGKVSEYDIEIKNLKKMVGAQS